MSPHPEAGPSRRSLLLTIIFTILSCFFWGLILFFSLKGTSSSGWISLTKTNDLPQAVNPSNDELIKNTLPPSPEFREEIEVDGFQKVVMDTIKQYDYPLFLYPVSQITRLPDDFPITSAQLALVNVGEVSVADIMLEPLTRLLQDAKQAGFSPYLRSGFRSIDDQYTAYSRYVTEATAAGMELSQAREYASRFSAEPGYSEHHLGLAIDLLDYFYPDWILARNNHDKGLYLWLQQHAHEYGFVISYPPSEDAMQAKPGSGYLLSEPWHLRFVGKELSNWLYKEGYLDPFKGITVNSTLLEAYLLTGETLPNR